MYQRSDTEFPNLKAGTSLTASFMSSSGLVKNAASGILSGGNQASLTTDVSGALPAANGGTGFASYAVGDTLYAASTTTLAKLTIGGATTVLHGGTIPSYSAVNILNDTNGTLSVGRGGTGQTTFVGAGAIISVGPTTLS